MTAEEYIIEKLKETESLNNELISQIVDVKQKNHHLECIVDTLKNHATLENGTVCIFLTVSQKNDRDFIVKALELKEEKPNE